MKLYKIIVLCLFCLVVNAQDIQPFQETSIAINNLIEGSLIMPTNSSKPPLAIIIAGSGPTDRDGNQNFLKNNSLKKLAEGLSKNGIATFRYDKRIVKQIRKGNVDPNITFDDFVTDAKAVLKHFKTASDFSKIYIIGHSQGSLVGMLAAKDGIDGFISLAGAGKSIDTVIMDQISTMAPSLVDAAQKAFNSLKAGQTTTDYPQALQSIFDPSLQAFMMSWMQYDPQALLKDIDCDVLILNGTKDLQVKPEEAELLKKAQPKAQLTIIDDMNHVLFIIKGDSLENSKSYNETFRPISEILLSTMISFIK
jgi:pimeloyl-ACP methyl ester carboxylesterase